jgi:hypothetical protein
MQEKRESIKIALLGLIALTLLVNTYFLASKKGDRTGKVSATSTAVAEQDANTALTPPANGNPNPDMTTMVNPGETHALDPASMTPPSNQKSTAISFATYQHDFGKIKQQSTNKYAFKFTNTGDEPLIITNAVGSCGCTVPNYPKEPIAPGKSATIDVEYKPGEQKGSQEKQVTITANTNPAETILKIKADVQEIPK